MPGLSSADHSTSPPAIHIPREYNAAFDLIERNLRAGRGAKVAYIDDSGRYTFADLADLVDRCANALLGLGLQQEQRVLLCLQDTIDFPVAFLGCIKAGIVPVAVNTQLKSSDYEYMLRDSRSRALIISVPLLNTVTPLLGVLPYLRHVIVSQGATERHHSFTALLDVERNTFEPATTCCDDPCFWLYSSGSTGAPKGSVHAHASLIQTAELYARPILGLSERDIVFSAPKLFFAYGLGNALTFPLAVGATTVLMSERPTPEAVFARLRQHQPTLFFGVPTLYAALLSTRAPETRELALRACVSAGEALPREIGEQWVRRFGVDILDGIGSTEMLHIFLSNRLNNVGYGTTGTAVPGYELRIVNEDGTPVEAGQIGELQIAGPTSALGYWNNRDRTQQTFQGAWTRSGDKCAIDARGRYVYAGRSDDMFKVNGMYVSPTEVEACLISHPAVLEAAVVAHQDEAGLTKVRACVVLKPQIEGNDALLHALRIHAMTLLAPYKCPRWVEFHRELPKTATGKIQRFRLRQADAAPGALSH